MSNASIFPKEQSDAVVGELTDARTGAALFHVKTYVAAAHGARSANHFMLQALREGSATEARRHRERRDWYVGLAWRHKDAAVSLKRRSAA